MSVTLRVLRDHQRGALMWALALMSISAFYLFFYPQMGDEMLVAMEALPQGLMAALGYNDIATATGYANSVVYRLLGLLLMLIYGLNLATRLLAGHEEDGVLELELTSPMPRLRLFGERLLALWLLLAFQAFALTLALLASNAIINLDLVVVNVWAASCMLWLLTASLSSLTFAVGAASGRRGVALGVGAAVAVGGYVLQGVGDGAGIDAMRAFTPFGWYYDSDALRRGLDTLAALKLLAVAAVSLPLGAWRFTRRDLMR
jgi:ABC-2 type transport system permease protein